MKKPDINKFEHIVSTKLAAEELAKTANPFVWVSCDRNCVPYLNRLCKQYGLEKWRHHDGSIYLWKSN